MSKNKTAAGVDMTPNPWHQADTKDVTECGYVHTLRLAGNDEVGPWIPKFQRELRAQMAFEPETLKAMREHMASALLRIDGVERPEGITEVYFRTWTIPRLANVWAAWAMIEGRVTPEEGKS